VHLVGFIIKTFCYDARSRECKNHKMYTNFSATLHLKMSDLRFRVNVYVQTEG